MGYLFLLISSIIIVLVVYGPGDGMANTKTELDPPKYVIITPHFITGPGSVQVRA